MNATTSNGANIKGDLLAMAAGTTITFLYSWWVITTSNGHALSRLPLVIVLGLVCIGFDVLGARRIIEKQHADFAARFKKLFAVPYQATAEHRTILQPRVDDQMVLLAEAHQGNLRKEESFLSSLSDLTRANVETTKNHLAQLAAIQKMICSSDLAFESGCRIIKRAKLEVRTYEQYLALR